MFFTSLQLMIEVVPVMNVRFILFNQLFVFIKIVHVFNQEHHVLFPSIVFNVRNYYFIHLCKGSCARNKVEILREKVVYPNSGVLYRLLFILKIVLTKLHYSHLLLCPPYME